MPEVRGESEQIGFVGDPDRGEDAASSDSAEAAAGIEALLDILEAQIVEDSVQEFVRQAEERRRLVGR